MKVLASLGLLLFAGMSGARVAGAGPQGWPGSAQRLQPVVRQVDPNVFVWSDTCNVYVIRDQDAALLIDLGDGSVLDHLSEIGVRRIEWVLFTHHHREQCQGAPRLQGIGAKVAGPEVERALFESPTEYRKMEVSLGDAFTIHGASYVRPPIQPIRLDRGFKTNDTFTWHGRELVCLDTRGNSPGGMSYLLKGDNSRLACSGDVIFDGAKMHTWFDTEWDYGFAAGIHALRHSVTNLAVLDLSALLPAHGPVVLQPNQQLEAYQKKLERLERLYLRGYDVESGSVAYQDKVSVPTILSNVVQITPHLFKFKRPNFWPNFGLILADSGRALAVDCGLLDETFLDTALQGMREHFGLKAIDAVIITHMHGDHFLEAPHLREKWGTKIWAWTTWWTRWSTRNASIILRPFKLTGKGLPTARGSRVFTWIALSNRAQRSHGKATGSRWTGCPAKPSSPSVSTARLMADTSPSAGTTSSVIRTIRPKPATRPWSRTTAPSSRKATSTARNS
jgi:glyoxylase-like metal-dependent hydrolase (beta-lactamase superfamily II)